jgi:hypothetical protein
MSEGDLRDVIDLIARPNRVDEYEYLFADDLAAKDK